MAFLAQKNSICSVNEIANAERISFDYLSKIFLKLKNAKLVGVKRGKQGGYFLAKPAHYCELLICRTRI